MRKAAKLAGVSVSTIQRLKKSITENKNPEDPQPSYEQSEPVTGKILLGLDLHGATKKRYLDVRKSVEQQIVTGKRLPLSAINGNS